MSTTLSCLLLIAACSAQPSGLSLSYGDVRDSDFGEVSMVTLSYTRPALDLSRGWRVAWMADAGAMFARDRPTLQEGELTVDERERDRGAMLAAGPVLQYQRRTGALRWLVEFGTRPAWLSQQEFNLKSLGSTFHFASHAGVYLEEVHVPVRVGFRYMHISNAGLAKQNPGVDIAVFSVGTYFGGGSALR